MFCSKCGKEVPENANVCGNCGNPVKTNLNAQQFDLSNVKGTFDNVVSNVKESWSSMGQKGTLLAIIGALLVVCMFMWRGEILKITVKIWGYKQSQNVSGKELIDSGLLSFLITVVYLLSIGAVAWPFITKTAVTKKLMLLTRAGTAFNLGALLGYLFFGFGEIADFVGGEGFFEMLKYVSFAPSGMGWLLLICMVATWVLSVKVEKEI